MVLVQRQHALTQQGYMCALSPPRFSMFPIMRCLRCRRLSNFKLKKRLLYIYTDALIHGEGGSRFEPHEAKLCVCRILCVHVQRDLERDAVH